MSARAGIVELFSRQTPVRKDASKDVIFNGEDNLYPNKIELVVQNSPTGSAAAGMLAKFIAGSGIIEDGKFVPYEKQRKVGESEVVYDLVKQTSRCLAVQSGFFWHVSYSFDDNLNLTPSFIKLVPYKTVRRYKGDDDGNSGKFYVRNFEKSNLGNNRKNGRWYWPFSRNQKVIKAQIAADAGVDVSELRLEDIQSYRGQIYYFNATPEFDYALSRFDPVYNDLDTEYRIGVYANTQSRLGFLGKTIFIFNGLDEEEQKEKDEEVRQFLGAEESGNAYVLHVDTNEDLSKVLRAEQLKPQFDDKLFEQTSKRCESNILAAANNLPKQLINVGDGAMFGTQGDTYRELKQFYTEQCWPDTEAIQNSLALMGITVEIAQIDYIEPNNIDNDTTSE